MHFAESDRAVTRVGDRPSLLDQIGRVPPSHPDRTRITTGILLLTEAAARRGVFLSISYDFDELAAVQRRNVDTWPILPQPVDPRFSTLGRPNALWVKGVDADGAVVVTRAIRHYDLGQRSIADAVEDYSLFQDRRDATGPDAPYARCSNPALTEIRGRINLNTGGWHHPRYRGQALSGIVPRLTRAVGDLHWSVPICCSLVEDHLRPKLVKYYEPERVEPGVAFFNVGKDGPMHLSLCIWSRAGILANLPTSMDELERWDRQAGDDARSVRQPQSPEHPRVA